MKVFLNEIYKVFIKRRLLALFIAVLLLECVGAFSSFEKSTVMDDDALSVYNQYMNKYGGELTQEKREEIERLIETTRRSETLRNELRYEYTNGKITLGEYKSGLKKIREDTKGEDGFFNFVSSYYSAVNSGTSLADSHIWDALFGYGGIDFLLVIFVIAAVIALSVYDDETGANQLAYSLKKGRALISARIVAAILIASMAAAVVFVCKLLIAAVFYNLDGFDNPLKFSEIFSYSPWKLTLLQGYLYICLIKTAGYIYLALLAMLTGRLCRSSLYTVFAGVTAVYIPGYILADFWIKYMLPVPSSLLSGNGYFSMSENASLTTASAEDAVIKAFSQTQLIIYFSGIAALLIFLCAINRLLWSKRKR